MMEEATATGDRDLELAIGHGVWSLLAGALFGDHESVHDVACLSRFHYEHMQRAIHVFDPGLSSTDEMLDRLTDSNS